MGKIRPMVMQTARTDIKLALLQWVVLPVFLLRALIPAGFMPDFSADHGATMTVCSGYEAKQVPVKHDGKQKGDHLPCGFSFTSGGPLAEAPSITPSETIASAPALNSETIPVARLSRGYRSQAPPAV